MMKESADYGCDGCEMLCYLYVQPGAEEFFFNNFNNKIDVDSMKCVISGKIANWHCIKKRCD
jgi:hypothetical protein